MANNFKKKLKSGELCLGTWISIGSPDVVDILRNLEFDWFVIDTEHSYISTETAKSMIQVLGDQPRQSPLVRVGINDQLLIKRALDIGAQGIVVPLVNSGEEAERAVRYAMYPPRGMRGAAGARASRYGMNLGGYLRSSNDEVTIAVQIETTEALSNLDEILGTKGVDIGFVGPTDLTMSLGLIDDRNNQKVVEAMSRVAKTCEKHGKTPGTMAVSVEEARKWISLGFKFVSLASDAKQLIVGAQSFLKL
ncbi:MAG: HpcH/HpaI aldolase family protein [Nitrososphaerales archaeon]